MTTEPNKKRYYLRIFSEGFVRGIGQALGATVGFAIVVWLLGVTFRQIGGLPVVGEFIADIVEVTIQNLHLDQIELPE